MIPLHVLDAARKNGNERNVDVYLPDTGVIILLMDLISNHQVKGEINFVTGKGKAQRKIDIWETCSAFTLEKSRGRVGLHGFSGADWGGKLSKKRWLESYLRLEEDSEVINVFQWLVKMILTCREI